MSLGRIAVIGAGAVGGYYGGRLAAAGHAVDFFTRSDAAAFKEQGLHVRSVHGDFTIERPSVFDDTSKMPTADLVVVALKATAIADYVRLIRPLVHDRSIVLCLQNGLGNEEIFAEAFGDDRVLGAIAYTCINRVGPGEIEHTAEGLVRVGAFGRADPATAEAIAATMRGANIDAKAVADLHHFRWHKLVWNIPFNGWGAALDRHTAQLLATPDGEGLIRETMAEVVRAAASVGVRLDEGLVDQQVDRTGGVSQQYAARPAGRAGDGNRRRHCRTVAAGERGRV